MNNDMTEVGVDGIRRSFDEHYDTVMDVKEDPTGAMWAIHKQADRIEELEAKLAEAVELIALCRKMQAQVAHSEDPLMLLIDNTLAELKG